jgi:hypothetical protein
MKTPALNVLERLFLAHFTFDDNDPSTYESSRKVFQTLRAYLANPFVKLKRFTHERLVLL